MKPKKQFKWPKEIVVLSTLLLSIIFVYFPAGPLHEYTHVVVARLFEAPVQIVDSFHQAQYVGTSNPFFNFIINISGGLGAGFVFLASFSALYRLRFSLAPYIQWMLLTVAFAHIFNGLLEGFFYGWYSSIEGSENVLPSHVLGLILILVAHTSSSFLIFRFNITQKTR